jgi:hypothetical protein
MALAPRLAALRAVGGLRAWAEDAGRRASSPLTVLLFAASDRAAPQLNIRSLVSPNLNVSSSDRATQRPDYCRRDLLSAPSPPGAGARHVAVSIDLSLPRAKQDSAHTTAEARRRARAGPRRAAGCSRQQLSHFVQRSRIRKADGRRATERRAKPAQEVRSRSAPTGLQEIVSRCDTPVGWTLLETFDEPAAVRGGNPRSLSGGRGPLPLRGVVR